MRTKSLLLLLFLFSHCSDIKHHLLWELSSLSSPFKIHRVLAGSERSQQPPHLSYLSGAVIQP